MVIVEWTKFIVGTLFLIFGLIMFALELFGVFKFKYVLNRMQVAAMGDTLGLGISLLGLMIMSGISDTSFKLFLVIVFLWLASPVSSHLIAKLEVTTDEHLEEHCEVEK